MAFVYILKLVDKSYYVGSCREIETRINQHKNGLVSSTEYKRPFEVVYLKRFIDYKCAFREEQRIKRWKKRQSIENLYNKDLENITGQLFGPIV